MCRSIGPLIAVLLLAPVAACGGSDPECSAAVDCPGADTDCQTRTCEDHKCRWVFAEAGTVAATQSVRDCQQLECEGNGGTTSVPLDTDTPTDGNECTQDLCADGVPSNPPAVVDSPCGSGLFCDGSGVCVGCNSAGQCGTDTECKVFDCVGTVCQITVISEGTPCTGGGRLCDGAGSCVACVVPADCPAPAPDSCRVATCIGNVCDEAAVPDRTECGDPICVPPTCMGGVCISPPCPDAV